MFWLSVCHHGGRRLLCLDAGLFRWTGQCGLAPARDGLQGEWGFPTWGELGEKVVNNGLARGNPFSLKCVLLGITWAVATKGQWRRWWFYA